jgi:hypothetical protein
MHTPQHPHRTFRNFRNQRIVCFQPLAHSSFALFHKSVAQLLYSVSLPHSFPKTPGCGISNGFPGRRVCATSTSRNRVQKQNARPGFPERAFPNNSNFVSRRFRASLLHYFFASLIRPQTQAPGHFDGGSDDASQCSGKFPRRKSQSKAPALPCRAFQKGLRRSYEFPAETL